MEKFDKVSERLKQWALQVENARVEMIADATKNAIKDLAGAQFFNLPTKFSAYIEEFERREGALQSIANYRDHFIHPFHVFVLGHRMLEQWEQIKRAKSKPEEIDRVPLQLIEERDIFENLKVWFVAAVYHDVGYPAEKLEALTNSFFKSMAGCELKGHSDWSPVLLEGDNIEHINKIASLFEEKVGKTADAPKDFRRWFYKHLLVDHNHGALAALMLLGLDWKEDIKVAYEAALAIALHSYKHKPKGKIDKKSNVNLGQLPVEDLSLAFFLSFCDYAQEWGRNVLLEDLRKSNKPDTSITDSGFLKEPVPQIEQRSSKDKNNRIITKINTRITINYPVDQNKTLDNKKTIKNTLREIAREFESSWYLKYPTQHNYSIQGEDESDNLIETIHPATSRK